MRDVIVAELDSPEQVVKAARRVKDLGYARIATYTPFPIHEIDDALALPRTKLPFLVLFAGMIGASIALLIQWWTNAVDYPLNVGGRPLNSIPTHVPIVFETTVLFAAVTAFASVLLAGRLPRIHHPVFDLPGFERTSIDRFWIVIGDAFASDADVRDEELAVLERELTELGATIIHARIARDVP